jgi:hypothetical protein
MSEPVAVQLTRAVANIDQLDELLMTTMRFYAYGPDRPEELEVIGFIYAVRRAAHRLMQGGDANSRDLP